MPKAPPLEPVQHVDLSRYMGRWYVIANIPYFLENGKVGTSDNYALLRDGRIQNDFVFHRGSFDAPERTWHGKGTVVNTKTNAEWKVSFLWPLSARYLVLDLDADYQWSVVSTPEQKLLWILSRSRSLSPATYADILGRLRQRGFDTNKLQRVPQPTAQPTPPSI